MKPIPTVKAPMIPDGKPFLSVKLAAQVKWSTGTMSKSESWTSYGLGL